MKNQFTQMKYLLSFVLLFSLVLVTAQNVILFEDDMVSQVNENVDISSAGSDFALEVYFQNVTDDTISVKWRREYAENCPNEWDVFVVDQFYSYVPSIDEALQSMILTPVDSHFITRNIYLPKGVPGCCDMKMIFFLDGFPDDPIDTAYFHMEINPENCGINPVLESPQTEFSIFPNPASTFFTIDNFDDAENVTIYDVKGQIQLGYSKNSSEVDISSLANGIYFLQIASLQGELHFEKLIVYRE